MFPSMFIGAAIGVAASGLPGMNLAAAIGMGIGAMCAAMLRLPLTSTLLAVVLMGVDGAGDAAGRGRSRRRLRHQQPAARTGSQDAPAAACDPRQSTQRRRCSRCWLAGHVIRNGLASANLKPLSRRER